MKTSYKFCFQKFILRQKLIL